MGILNVTPDSFSDGGLYLHPEQALKHAETMLAAGADIIDVGGQSSRPGAVPVPAEVEQARAVPVIREIVHRYGALVSIDTYRASVAAAALDAGAVLVNDISAMRFDARRHLSDTRFGGRAIDAARRRRFDETLGVAALTRARAAQHQRQRVQ